MADAPRTMDLSQGRSYAFSMERPIDFTIDLNLFLQGDRNFFNKGLYWESAPANQMISSSLYNMMGAPSVLDLEFTHDLTSQSCDVFRCYFQSFLNYSGSYEVWMPPKNVLVQYFRNFEWIREKYISCLDPMLSSLEKTPGYLEYKQTPFDRYINPNASLVRPYSADMPTDVRSFANKCIANSKDDGRVDRSLTPELQRSSSGDYKLNLPSEVRKWTLSLQYFEGFKYDTQGKEALIPAPEKLGMTIEGSGPTHLYFERPWIFTVSYVISILSYLLIGIWYWVNRRRSSDPGK
jgi:hypothetical protein